MISSVDPSARSLALADELRPALIRLGRALRQETEQLGITSRQAALLWHVQRRPGLSLRELAEEERISPPSLSAHVDRLESLGLVARFRSTDDRRRVGLVLTQAGERLLRRVRTRRTAWLASRLGALDADELALVEAALPALLRLLDEDGT